MVIACTILIKEHFWSEPGTRRSIFFPPLLFLPLTVIKKFVRKKKCGNNKNFRMSTEEESERRQKQQRPVSSLSAPVVSSDEPRLNGSSNFGGNRSSPMRPKLNTIHSSDASRFMTLERLQHLKPTSTKKHPQIIKDCSAGGQQDRQLTIETAIFPEQQPMFQSEKGWRSSNGGSQVTIMINFLFLWKPCIIEKICYWKKRVIPRACDPEASPTRVLPPTNARPKRAEDDLTILQIH